jgi:hypothetical protein
MSIIIPSIGNSISHGGILMKKDKMKSKNTDYSCDDYDDFFEDNIVETESDYDDISDFEPPRDVPKREE